MILKHRDRELLRFEWLNRESVRILSVNEAERRFLPLEMKGEATNEAMQKWMRRRSAPKIDLDCETSVRGDTEKGKDRSAYDTDEQILENLRADPFVSTEELAEVLRVSVITVKRRIANLKKANRIRRVGSTKTGHWEILK